MIGRVGEGMSQTAKPIQIKEQYEKAEIKQQPIQEPFEQAISMKEEELQKFTEQVNTFLQPTKTHIQFEFHEDLQEYYAVIVDDVSKEVIKEIPSEKLLDMQAAMTEFLGLLFDKKV